MALRFSPSRGAGSFALSAAVRGPQGAAATITVGTTQELDAGEDAEVTNSGTTSAAVLNFYIPRGQDAGFKYTFESSTSMAAPATGGIRLNNATIASVTTIAVSPSTADSGNPDVSDYVATWDDSTNSNKGSVVLRKEGSGTVLGIFTITSITDNTTWLQINGTYVSGGGTLTAGDRLYLSPLITGNSGEVASSANFTADNRLTRTDRPTTDNKVIQQTGISVDDSDNISGMATLTLPNTGLHLLDTNASHDLIIAPGSNLTADHTLTLTTGDADRTLTISGNHTLPGGNSAVLEGGQTLTGGFSATSDADGTQSSGTYTPDAATGNFKHITNGGAFTLGVPSTVCTVIVQITNNGSAGAITTSGYTKVTGDGFTTTNGHDFLCFITKSNDFSHLHVQTLQ